MKAKDVTFILTGVSNKLPVSIALFVIVVLFLLYQLVSFDLIKTSSRGGSWPLSASLKTEIADDTRGMAADEIIDYSTKRTARMLSFARRNDISIGKANCIGYARLCASICQYAMNANNVQGKAVPVVGDVRKFGVSICWALGCIVPSSWRNFVKDHDFVEVQLPDKTVYVDACFYDYTFNDCKCEKKKR